MYKSVITLNFNNCFSYILTPQLIYLIKYQSKFLFSGLNFFFALQFLEIIYFLLIN